MLIGSDKNLPHSELTQAGQRPYIFRRKVIWKGEQRLSSLGHGLNGRSIDEQISGICRSRRNQSCRHGLGLLDAAEFIWHGIRISAGRFNEPGLCGWLPSR